MFHQTEDTPRQLALMKAVIDKSKRQVKKNKQKKKKKQCKLRGHKEYQLQQRQDTRRIQDQGMDGEHRQQRTKTDKLTMYIREKHRIKCAGLINLLKAGVHRKKGGKKTKTGNGNKNKT